MPRAKYRFSISAALIALTVSIGLALAGGLVVPAVEAETGVTLTGSNSCKDVVVGCIPVSRAGGPAPPKGADRIESFSPNLDKDESKERVFVYNLPNDGFNTTYFEVWNRKHDGWKRGQVKLVAGVPGSSPYYGLEQAWVSDLTRDGRVEIAVRHSVTSSVGEVLPVYRQTSRHSTRFAELQSFYGDEVKVEPRKKKPAVVKAFLKSNHSPDNLEHREVWKWSEMADQWTCRRDCATPNSTGMASATGHRIGR